MVMLFFRNKVSSMIRTAKNDMYKNKIEKGKDDPRTIWKIFKEHGASSKKKNSIKGVKGNNNSASR